MTMATIRQERDNLLKQVRDLAAKAETEGRPFSDDEQASAEELLGKAKGKSDELARYKSLSATQAEVAALMASEQALDLNASVLKGATLGAGAYKSVGHVFTDSDAYKALKSKANSDGQFSDSLRGFKTDPVQIGGLKALLTGANHTDSAGALVQPQQLGVAPYPVAPFGLSDLITQGTTTSDRVEYAQVLPVMTNGSTNNAAGVPEATDVTGDGIAAGVKPRSDLKFKKAGADVITVATWTPATKRSLADVGQLRTLIDNFLRTNVQKEIERQIISGDADAPATAGADEFDGIMNTTGVLSQPWVEGARGLFATARKMITKVEAQGGRFTGYAVSPETAEVLDLAADENGRLYGAGPFASGPQTLWGRPRVTVYGLPAGKMVGGDWSTCVLWDREDTTVTATDSHADFFIRNLVAVLAEARAAFGLFNPQVMCVADAADPTP